MHQLMAGTMEDIIAEITSIQDDARVRGKTARPQWPILILRSPKGWTGPKEVDGLKTEDFWRSHQVPFAKMDEDHIKLLESWMKSYQAEELFDANGTLIPELAELAPKGKRRMGDNPHANGGQLLKDLRMPDFRDYAVEVPAPGQVIGEATRSMGKFLRDVMKLNLDNSNFRVLGPMRSPQTGWQTSSKLPTAPGWNRRFPKMTTFLPTAG
jgi:xylulose-5-phosphate/fructose-6-phosphate phosphoketolase